MRNFLRIAPRGGQELAPPPDFCYPFADTGGPYMPRPATTPIQSIIEDAVADVFARLSRAIGRVVEERVADQLKGRPAGPPKERRARRRAARRPRAAEITKWIADRRARRVPTFVIEATGGLDTKKKIVARFGENVVFEKGKPLPKPKAA
jgi:hypothetical protein